MDAGPLVALATLDHPLVPAALAFLNRSSETLILPAPVAAEVDYLLQARLGPRGNTEFLQDLAAGRFVVECLHAPEYSTVLALNDRYRAFSPGLCDLSIVVIAGRLGVSRILTFDVRHFRAMTPLQGGAFTLLPMDPWTPG